MTEIQDPPPHKNDIFFFFGGGGSVPYMIDNIEDDLKCHRNISDFFFHENS